MPFHEAHAGTWCSGITSASHAEGPGFKSQCVHIFCPAAAGPVAQWIRHRPTEPGIAGSSPAGVIFSTSALHAVLLLKLFDLHAIFSSPIPCSLFLFSFSVAFIFGFCWNLCIGMPGYLCFSLRFLQEKKGERERERERDANIERSRMPKL